MFHGRHQTIAQDYPPKNQDPYTQHLAIISTVFDDINIKQNNRGDGKNGKKYGYDDNKASLLGMFLSFNIIHLMPRGPKPYLYL